MDPTAQGNSQNNNPPITEGSEPSTTSSTQDQYSPPQQTSFEAQASQDQAPQARSNINQQPAPDMVQAYSSSTQSPHEALTDKPKSSKKGFFLFFIFIFLLILVMSGLGSLTYAVAYEKIKLDKYPDVQKTVSYYVMDLSFMPKTPKFLLAKTALAHQSVTKQSFDISAAIDSSDISSSLGLSGLDVQAKGALDYTDPKNVFGNLDLSFTKDFNFELRKKEEMLYFRINKLPNFLFAFLGICSDSFDPLLGKWVSYDTTPMDTEARKIVQEDKEVDPLSEEFIDENFEKYLDDEVLSKLVLSSDTEEGHAVYKITLNADSELIDHLGKTIEDSIQKDSNYMYPQSQSDELDKLSDFVKSLKWEMFIDKETYYTRKVTLSIDLEYDQSDGLGAFSMGSLMNPLPSNNKAKIALAVKFDSFGEEVVVEEPTEFMTFEEFTDMLSKAISELYGGVFSQTQEQIGQINDARRKMDIATMRSAMELYRADCGKYPTSLDLLIESKKANGCAYETKYLTSIPIDPDGSEYYIKVSGNGTSYDLCAKLEVPLEQSTACPNATYNYHITSYSNY